MSITTATKHFIDLDIVGSEACRIILDTAIQEKFNLKSGKPTKQMVGKQLAMIFEKPSTRTRISFEAGINQLGGHAIILDSQSTQLGRGETIEDTAKVLSRYVDFIMIRCHAHDTLLQLAEHASIPVINGLTNFSHPCQVMADIMTFIEHRGSIKHKKIAWIGDGNNMAHSWIHAAQLLDFTLVLATPEQLKPNSDLLKAASAINPKITWTTHMKEAASEADLITTDTWVSMGDKDADFRHRILASYQVNAAVMQQAKPDALFMHCLPAHRNEEVTPWVIDGPQSVIFDEAENRLHVQKAILLWSAGAI